MPIYNFECPKCKNKFEELSFNINNPEEPCPKCKTLSKRVMGCFYSVYICIKGGWIAKKDPNVLDDGIPFGEVPGDEDYIGIDKPDYLGPRP